jgi:hypothetical protein
MAKVYAITHNSPSKTRTVQSAAAAALLNRRTNVMPAS